VKKKLKVKKQVDDFYYRSIEHSDTPPYLRFSNGFPLELPFATIISLLHGHACCCFPSPLMNNYNTLQHLLI